MSESRAAAAYVRISDDRARDAAGVARQTEDCETLASRKGWTIAEVYAENDTSAFKRRKMLLPDGTTDLRVDRPKFRRMLDDLKAGTRTAVVVYDLDRMARDMRDLEDLIDVVEQHDILIASVTGSFDLSNDGGITMARVMVAFANKSSRDTARRVTRKHLELAEQGRVAGGGVYYGYARDGLAVDEDQAAVVREIAGRILAGESLSEIARDLTARRVPTARGAAGWNTRSVHSVVTKARIAGLREHRGELVGPAQWPPIVDRATWEQVRGALADRARGSNNRFVGWLTGVLLCGRCGHPMARWPGGGKDPATGRNKFNYWCVPRKGGCGRVAVSAPAAEGVVEGWVVDYLARPDVLAELAAATSRGSADTARKEAAELEAQLVEAAQDYAKRDITKAEYFAQRRVVVEKLKTAHAIMRYHTPAGLRRLLDAGDVLAAWVDTPPVDRREAARLVFPAGIVVRPARRGLFAFDERRLVPVQSAP